MKSAAHTDWSAYDRQAAHRSMLHVDGTNATAHLGIDGMHCGNCALKIEKRLRAISGVKQVGVNAATHRMQMSWNLRQVPFSRLLQAIAELGFTPHIIDVAGNSSSNAAALQDKRTALKRLAVAGLCMAQVMTFAFALYAGAAHGMDADIERYLRLVSLLASVPVVCYSAVPFFTSAWRDLQARRMGMDLPVSLATALAFAASVFNTLRGRGEVYFDSVTMFVFFLLLGRFIEMQTRHRSGSITEALAHLLPPSVQRLRDSRAETVELAMLEVGDRVLAPPGAAIAADGRIVAGMSTVDESLLTGESTPLSRKPGDAVLGGSLNLTQPLTIEITATGAQTALSNIVRLLERAQAERPRLGRAADRAAAGFVLGVLLLSALVAGLWLHFDPVRAFPATLAVLVVTCPCALSLATPAAIAAATTVLARKGLLVTHADAIEALAQARRCVFDKTGTLTQGAPRISATKIYGVRRTDECLAIAAALEAHSEHPLAAAFASAGSRLEAREVRVYRGSGLEGEIDGTLYRIGKLEFVRGLNPQASAFAFALMPDADIYLADRSGVQAVFEIDDALRPQARTAVDALRALGVESEIASGDHRHAVRRTAEKLGVATWHARLTPEEKLERITRLNNRPGGLIMVGDGINDAPVLGAARVSVAMGGGSALAHASADSILIGASLEALPDAVRTARRTLHIIRQNLWWAAGYNLMAVPLAAFGAVAPWAAAIGMSLSSLLVVLNAGRIGREVEAIAVPASQSQIAA